MQLTKIKLSGFKSFVEKTEINFSNRRTGIVGPNGCGKSNIIDAIRWVLGESRATELRGESLQDVIFSGSSSRHKAGRASVELFFDNPNGKVSGPWGEYSEISVKKTVTSDGQANSFINDRNVRRKDILDLFLGTGLGPKSYAIIGQGMIGKIVDAKPEELRVFLEEASGVSKYRQRRKETESRLSDGRESMNRVSDLVLELEERIKSLEKQAKIAAVFQEKNESKKNLKLFLLWKKKKSLAHSIALCEKELESEKLECDRLSLAIKTIELELASNREKGNILQKNLDENNQSYFEINNKISTHENENKLINEKILHAKEISNNSTLMINNVESSIELENQNLLKHDEKLTISDNLISKKTLSLNEFKNKISPIENLLNDIQLICSEERAKFAVLESEKLNYESQIRNLLDAQKKQNSKISDLTTELNEMETVSDVEINALNKLSEDRTSDAENAKEKVIELQAKKEDRKLNFQEINNDYIKIDKEFVTLSAEYSGLISIQKKMLDLDSLESWLSKHKLSSLPSLVSLLKVNTHWEIAIEAVLKNRLGAIQIDSIDKLKISELTNPPVSVSFISTENFENKNELVHEIDGFKNLSFAIESENEASKIVRELVKDFFCVSSIEEAIKNKHKLKFHTKFITTEGNVVGKSDLFLHSQSLASSLLGREEKIDTLKNEICNLEFNKNEISLLLNTARDELKVSTNNLEQARENATFCIQEAHKTELKLVVLREKSDSVNQKKQSLIKDIDLFGDDLANTKAKVLSIESQQRQNKKDILSSQDKLKELDQNLLVSSQELSLLNEEFKSLEVKLQHSKLDQRSIIESRGSTVKRIEDFESAKNKANLSKQNAIDEILRLETTLNANSLDQYFDMQKSIEEKLKSSRNLLEAKFSEIRMLDEKKIILERNLTPVRQKLSKLEIEKSKLDGVVQELDEQFLLSGLNSQEVKSKLIEKIENYEKLSTDSIEKQINVLTKEIQGLGMVNLAAIEELDEISSRKNNFVSQLNDLEEAEMELSEAIKRMDIETKQLLQKTFIKVNDNLKTFFTSLFGGGYSKLIFLENDILNSGISLLAQPPGKKITKIQQLSGGEKSLAAIALVFSFFKLNPAPFCILDEADAALDDANTVGLNKLLCDLSDITQFIFITHNKTLMEIAEQLIGITMQELGVSRAVTVDLESAESFVEEAA